MTFRKGLRMTLTMTLRITLRMTCYYLEDRNTRPCDPHLGTEHLGHSRGYLHKMSVHTDL